MFVDLNFFTPNIFSRMMRSVLIDTRLFLKILHMILYTYILVCCSFASHVWQKTLLFVHKCLRMSREKQENGKALKSRKKQQKEVKFMSFSDRHQSWPSSWQGPSYFSIS